ncbi:MAG: phosphoribosylamine--glycine ligase [Acidobacteria bacterium]|nr:phosphoribosylamine--glycine ligase [Acidobacteriota bacterium]
MKLLLVGGGAREHALAWKLSGEQAVRELVCGPGNAGIAGLARCVPLDVADPEAILAVAEREQVDFTVVGPELPLANGVADVFAAAGRPLFGPRKAAARLESSKVYAKRFMARHGIPTARFRVCDTADAALAAVAGEAFGFPVVVKADGLAAGKGVTVAPDRATAEAAVRAAMVDGRFGAAGSSVVIEECLAGEEASFFVLCDGRSGLALPSAQDHKRAFDGDRGPNTGGMGAFAPSPLVSRALADRVMAEVVQPTLDGLRADGAEYRGVLYVGLMLTRDGPQVIEFNVRFGDPEAQVVLPMIETDLAPILFAAATGDLGTAAWRTAGDPHVGVVMASGGYPGKYETGHEIDGLAAAEAVPGVVVFHAGSRLQDGRILTSGGRVLTVVGRGGTFGEARERAYRAAACISFPDKHVRTDIGMKAIAGGG